VRFFEMRIDKPHKRIEITRLIKHHVWFPTGEYFYDGRVAMYRLGALALDMRNCAGMHFDYFALVPLNVV
jgi:hypothetical protein